MVAAVLDRPQTETEPEMGKIIPFKLPDKSIKCTLNTCSNRFSYDPLVGIKVPEGWIHDMIEYGLTDLVLQAYDWYFCCWSHRAIHAGTGSAP